MDLLPNDVVRQRTKEIVENNLNTKNYTGHIEGGSEKGDNYIGVVYRGKFCVGCDKKNEKCNSKDCKRLNLVIKVPPQNKVRREKFFARPCFLHEAYAYDDVLPTFMKFQESKGITPTENGFHHVPHCYGTITDEFNEAIFLSDLSEDGFEMYDRQKYITVEHVNLVMKILGKYHAISFAMKDQCPEKFKKYKEIDDIFRDRKGDQDFENYLEMMKDRAIGTLSPERHQDYIDRLNNMFSKSSFMDLLLEAGDGRPAEPYTIVCHGDCWNNNILYRYEKGELVDARLIDFQVLRYSSPACDLLYFIFLATSKEIREKYYKGFIDTYYESVSTFISRLGSSPDKVFPRKALDDQLKQFGRFGFFIGCILTPILTTYSEDVPDLDELSDLISKGEQNDMNSFVTEKSQMAYTKRMQGIILDMFELGYL